MTRASNGRALFPWSLAGLVAGLALAGSGLALRLVAGVPAFPELVQDRLLDFLPGSVLGRLIDTLQFRARPLLLLGLTSMQVFGGLLFACLMGILIRKYPDRIHGGSIFLAGATTGLLYWLTLTVVLPGLLGIGVLFERLPNGVRSAIWMLPLYACYGLSLGTLSALYAQDLPEGTSEEHSSLGRFHTQRRSRRRVIGLAVSSVAAAIAAGSYWRMVVAGNEGATFGALASPITTNDEFYVVSKNYLDPAISADSWRLELNGLVENPLTLSYTELTAFAPVETPVTLECISNGVGGKLISTAHWAGSPLAAILRRAQPADSARWVVFSCADGYEESVPIDVALRDSTMLVYAMNGVPLPAKHGFPVRVLVAGRYGMKNPKWLTAIRLTAQPYQSIWERTGWNGDLGVETMARFHYRPIRPKIGDSVLLSGVAFAGDRGISSVQVSTDSRVEWEAAELRPAPGTLTWSQWNYRWLVRRSGPNRLIVRAVDGAGIPQKIATSYSFPSGATGYHSITVLVV